MLPKTLKLSPTPGLPIDCCVVCSRLHYRRDRPRLFSIAVVVLLSKFVPAPPSLWFGLGSFHCPCSFFVPAPPFRFSLGSFPFVVVRCSSVVVKSNQSKLALLCCCSHSVGSSIPSSAGIMIIIKALVAWQCQFFPHQYFMGLGRFIADCISHRLIAMS